MDEGAVRAYIFERVIFTSLKYTIFVVLEEVGKGDGNINNIIFAQHVLCP